MTYRNALLLGLSAVALQGCIAAAAIPIVAGSGALVRSGVSDDARSSDRAPEYAVEVVPPATPAPAPAPAPTPAPALAAAQPAPPVAAPVAQPAPQPVAPPAAAAQPALVTFDEPEFEPSASASSGPEPVIVMRLQEPRVLPPAEPPAPTQPDAASLAAFEQPAAPAVTAPAPVAAPPPREPEPEPVELAAAAPQPAPVAAPQPARVAVADAGLPEEPTAAAPAPGAASTEAEQAAAVAAMTRPVPPVGGPIVPGQRGPLQANPVQPSPVPAAPVPARTPTPAPAPTGEPAAVAARATPPVAVAPNSADDPFGVGYAALRSYTLRALGGGVPLPSAQLADPTSLQPLRRQCDANSPVVIFDLDPAGSVVPLVGPLAVNTDLARVLQDLRSRGVNIAWLTDRTAIDARAVRDRLVAAGLDPRSEDSIYVERYPGETKQARRDAIAQTQCVIAMAGDERADFDDLYNYIIERNDARALEPMLGSGWFLIDNPVTEN